MRNGLPGVVFMMPSYGPVSYLKFDDRYELSVLRSDASTLVMFPTAAAPPGFDV